MTGIVVALIAIILVSQQASSAPIGDTRVHVDERRAAPPGVGIALLSGVAVGIFFLCLAQTRSEAGMWPLLVARASSTVLFAVGAMAIRIPYGWPRSVVAPAVLGGAIDMVANAAYLVATRGGALSVIVTLVSLYPASTVVLARLFLAERFSALQSIGIVLALLAVLLIVAGG
jgi:drug/metabolite transporter (DMT)-like permease